MEILEADGIYTAKELAKILHKDTGYIRKMASAKKIPSVEIRGTRLFCGWMVKNWLTQSAMAGD